MNDFFKGLGHVCLGTLAGAGLGAASFFAIEAVLPKQSNAAPAHTVAKTVKHEPKLSAKQTILEANRHLIANGWRPAPEKTPTLEERRLASVALESLSACSSTGVGFVSGAGRQPSAIKWRFASRMVCLALSCGSGLAKPDPPTNQGSNSDKTTQRAMERLIPL